MGFPKKLRNLFGRKENPPKKSRLPGKGMSPGQLHELSSLAVILGNLPAERRKKVEEFIRISPTKIRPDHAIEKVPWNQRGLKAKIFSLAAKGVVGDSVYRILVEEGIPPDRAENALYEMYYECHQSPTGPRFSDMPWSPGGSHAQPPRPNE